MLGGVFGKLRISSGRVSYGRWEMVWGDMWVQSSHTNMIYAPVWVLDSATKSYRIN
jgi:hypothetical protein